MGREEKGEEGGAEEGIARQKLCNSFVISLKKHPRMSGAEASPPPLSESPNQDSVLVPRGAASP